MTRTSVRKPAAPMWNCCKARPAKVMQGTDGTAWIVCQSCSSGPKVGEMFGITIHELPVWSEGIENNGQYAGYLTDEEDSELCHMFGVFRGIDAIGILSRSVSPWLLEFRQI